MAALNKIAFVLDGFAVPSPAQQLLNRFHSGYPRDGAFHRLENCRISVLVTGGLESAGFARREKDPGLRVSRDLRETLEGADGVVIAGINPGATGIVIAGRSSGAEANDERLKEILQNVPQGARCFVHGAIGTTMEGARQLEKLASLRRVTLLAGTPLGVTWRLPPVEIPKSARLRKALIVVQGKAPVAEFDGLEGLMPVIERRRGGEKGIRSVRFLEGDALWLAGDKGQWSWPLLASALSRSDSPQGDPVRDGRTQDLAGLGLVPKLAREPRGWVMEHRDGLRSVILVLDGVIADYNFAVHASDGGIISAQIYRPPAPAEHQFTRLAEVIEDFFRSGKRPWPVERSILIAGLLEVFRNPASRSGQLIQTPGLGLTYSA